MKKKTSISFAIALTLFLALVAGAWWLLASLSERNSQVASAREELASETATMRTMEQIRRSVITSTEEQAELAKYFITEESIPVFLGDLEAIARATGIDMSINSVSGGEDQLTVSVRARGEFARLHQYLALLEHSPYRLEIRRLFMQYSPNANPSLGPVLPWSSEFEIVLTSYES